MSSNKIRNFEISSVLQLFIEMNKENCIKKIVHAYR